MTINIGASAGKNALESAMKGHILGQQMSQDIGELRNGVAPQVCRGRRGCFQWFRQWRCFAFSHDFVLPSDIAFGRSQAFTVWTPAVLTSYQRRPV